MRSVASSSEAGTALIGLPVVFTSFFKIKIVLFSAHTRHGVVNLAMLDCCLQKRSQDLVRNTASVRWPGFKVPGRGSPSLAPGSRFFVRHADWFRPSAQPKHSEAALCTARSSSFMTRSRDHLPHGLALIELGSSKFPGQPVIVPLKLSRGQPGLLLLAVPGETRNGLA